VAASSDSLSDCWNRIINWSKSTSPKTKSFDPRWKTGCSWASSHSQFPARQSTIVFNVDLVRETGSCTQDMSCNCCTTISSWFHKSRSRPAGWLKQRMNKNILILLWLLNIHSTGKTQMRYHWCCGGRAPCSQNSNFVGEEKGSSWFREDREIVHWKMVTSEELSSFNF
jgi:hypothetical protein